jgi:uncharacterized SAM-binding protein YcdF (DUF218 family)
VVRPSRLFVFTILLFAVVVLARPVWLPWIGEALVRNDGPGKADIVVVLAGDYAGGRIEQAAKLVKEGYAPAVLVDGPLGPYQLQECDLAIHYIVSQGYPADWFIPLPMQTHSTEEESLVTVRELERRRVGSFLLVTSEFHSARAARVFRHTLKKRGDHVALRVVASRDDFFQPDAWWRQREGRKATLLEWTKTVAGAIGL